LTSSTCVTTTMTASSSSSSSYSEWPVQGINRNGNYEMELLLDDIHASLNMDDLDSTDNVRPQEQRRADAFLWGLNAGATTSSSSSSPTWGIIGETNTATPAIITNKEDEQQSSISRLHRFVQPPSAARNEQLIPNYEQTSPSSTPPGFSDSPAMALFRPSRAAVPTISFQENQQPPYGDDSWKQPMTPCYNHHSVSQQLFTQSYDSNNNANYSFSDYQQVPMHHSNYPGTHLYCHQDSTQMMLMQQQQQRPNNRLSNNCYGNHAAAAAVGYYSMDHAALSNEMMTSMNMLDHYHAPYPTTPQTHRNNTSMSSPIDASPRHPISGTSPPQQQVVPSISSLVGQIRRLSRDQMGCRMLQQALAENNPEVATTIFNELLPYMAELMMDPFGNYLFQKLLDCISLKEREVLVKTVSARLVQSSLNLHGTRSVQKIIETVSAADCGVISGKQEEAERKESNERIASMLAFSLKPAAARLCIDSHGNHVMQRILSGFPPQYTEFIYECVASNVTDVARHRHGCCVIQRCLDSHPHLHYVDESAKKLLDPCSASIIEARRHLIQQICAGALQLMQDAYGNYVVQYVLDICVGQPGEFEIIDSICRATIGQLSLLSVQKFSSNVIEKCLEKCSAEMRDLYLEEMCNEKKISELMTDPFGNYVAQRALGVASHAYALKLVECMKPHLVGMKNTAPGRRIIGKIIRRFPNYVLDSEEEATAVADHSNLNVIWKP